MNFKDANELDDLVKKANKDNLWNQISKIVRMVKSSNIKYDGFPDYLIEIDKLETSDEIKEIIKKYISSLADEMSSSYWNASNEHQLYTMKNVNKYHKMLEDAIGPKHEIEEESKDGYDFDF